MYPPRSGRGSHPLASLGRAASLALVGAVTMVPGLALGNHRGCASGDSILTMVRRLIFSGIFRLAGASIAALPVSSDHPDRADGPRAFGALGNVATASGRSGRRSSVGSHDLIDRLAGETRWASVPPEPGSAPATLTVRGGRTPPGRRDQHPGIQSVCNGCRIALLGCADDDGAGKNSRSLHCPVGQALLCRPAGGVRRLGQALALWAVIRRTGVTCHDLRSDFRCRAWPRGQVSADPAREWSRAQREN